MVTTDYSQGLHVLRESDLPAILAEHDEAPHGEKRALLEKYALHFGCSVDTLYRRLRRHARHAQREVRVRADAGRYRVSKATIRDLYELQLASADFQKRGKLMSARATIKRAEAAGIIEPGTISASRYNARLVAEGYRVPQARVRIQAATVNERHLLDASGTEYLTVFEDLGEGDWLLGVRDRDLNANTKKWKGVRALWLVGIIDDRSRCAFVKYYATVGEDTFTILSFLQEAWQSHPQLPFGGLPFNLQTDNGAFARNMLTRGFLEQPEINVHHTRTKAYEKESQGKIERLWRTIKSDFEHPLVADARKHLDATGKALTFTLSELNAWLTNWLIEYNHAAHPVETHRTRAEIWTEMQSRQLLRLPPDDMARIAYGTETKTLSAYADFNVKALRNNDSAGWFHVPTMYARKRVLILRNVAGEVLVRDPLDPEQKTVRAEPGRRETRPTWDEEQNAGESVRIYDDYVTGTGIGRMKTPSEHVAEKPNIQRPLVNPYESRPEAPIHMTSRQADAPEVQTPFTHGDEFFGVDEAKRWLAQRLGKQLGYIRHFQPDIMREIDTALDHSLDKQFLENRAREWSTTLLTRERRAGGNAGA